jgi:hypothetical protein
MIIVLTDPIEVKLSQLNFFNRWVCTLLNDLMDSVFIHLSFKITFIVIALSIFLFISPNFYLLFYLCYLIILLTFFPEPYVLLLHNIYHRKLFKKNYAYFNKFILLYWKIFLA